MLDQRRLGPWRDRLEEVFLHQEPDRRRLIRRCAVAALLLVVAVYADVIFRGASVSGANYLNVTVEPFRNRVQLYPERTGREAYHAYFDIGGAAFQSEPGAQFMRRSFWNGESVYWNPYSATGSYGIETLVDVKTSPLSMIVALLGGSDAVFHLAFLGFSFLGVFCLLVLLTVQWRLSLLAAIAGGITYLLNGYNVANLAANFAQTWLYFPVLALALVSFAKNPRVLSFLGIAAGAALILATTFLPTTIVILGATAIRRSSLRHLPLRTPRARIGGQRLHRAESSSGRNAWRWRWRCWSWPSFTCRYSKRCATWRPANTTARAVSFRRISST